MNKTITTIETQLTQQRQFIKANNQIYLMIGLIQAFITFSYRASLIKGSIVSACKLCRHFKNSFIALLRIRFCTIFWHQDEPRWFLRPTDLTFGPCGKRPSLHQKVVKRAIRYGRRLVFIWS